MTPLEPAANGVNLASILLAGRASIHTWWTGIVGCILFMALFVSTRLYADATLQLFFIVTSAIGWRDWARSRGRAGSPAVSVRRATKLQLVAGVTAAIAVTTGYATLLAATTDAAAPVPDSAVLAFSVLAQLLLMARCVETWWFWLLVNTLAVPLYASRAPGVTVPRDDAPDHVHRRFCVFILRELLDAPVDAVFSSEAYGPGFADVLARGLGRPVTHVAVDPTLAAALGTAWVAEYGRERWEAQGGRLEREDVKTCSRSPRSRCGERRPRCSPPTAG